MNPTLTQTLERRLSENPASPLFARLAEALLRHGEIDRAERLCDRGLELYPEYATARLIRAHCLAARGRHSDALGMLMEVSGRYPGNIVLQSLEDEWSNLPLPGSPPMPSPAAAQDAGIEAEDSAAEALVAEALMEASTPPDAVEDPAAESPAAESPDDEPVTAGVTVNAPTADVAAVGGAVAPESVTPADLTVPAELSADTLPALPIPAFPAPPPTVLPPAPGAWVPAGFIEGNRIVSRTLAEIYASQGAIGEAVETYRILLERMPDRRGMLEGRLRELEQRLGLK